MLLQDARRRDERNELGLGTFLRAIPGPVNTKLFDSENGENMAYRIGEECWNFFQDEQRKLGHLDRANRARRPLHSHDIVTLLPGQSLNEADLTAYLSIAAECIPHAAVVPLLTDEETMEKRANIASNTETSEIVIPHCTNDGDWLLVFIRLNRSSMSWTAEVYDPQDRGIPPNRVVTTIQQLTDHLRYAASPFTNWEAIQCCRLRVPEPQHRKHESGIYVIRAAQWLLNMKTDVELGWMRAAIAVTLADGYLPTKS